MNEAALEDIKRMTGAGIDAVKGRPCSVCGSREDVGAQRHRRQLFGINLWWSRWEPLCMQCFDREIEALKYNEGPFAK